MCTHRLEWTNGRGQIRVSLIDRFIRSSSSSSCRHAEPPAGSSDTDALAGGPGLVIRSNEVSTQRSTARVRAPRSGGSLARDTTQRGTRAFFAFCTPAGARRQRVNRGPFPKRGVASQTDPPAHPFSGSAESPSSSPSFRREGRQELAWPSRSSPARLLARRPSRKSGAREGRGRGTWDDG